MASPAIIRNALATRLDGLSTGGKKLQIHRRWPGQLNPPCAVLLPGVAEPEQTFGRGDLTRWTFDLYLFAPLSGGYDNGQEQLDPLLATSSTGGVFGMIAADRTLGGVVDSVFVQAFRDYDQYPISENLDCLGAVVNLEVWAS